MQMMSKVEVVKFTSYEYGLAAAVFVEAVGKDAEEMSVFQRVLVMTPTEAGGPRYEPLTDEEREGFAKAAEEHPELGKFTRRAHFHDAILSMNVHGVRRFQHPNDLVLYVTDEEPQITDGPHPAKSVAEAGFGRGYFRLVEKIDMNPKTATVTLMLLGAGLGVPPEAMKSREDFMKSLLEKAGPELLEKVGASLAESMGDGTKERPFVGPNDGDAAIVAKTTFHGGKFGLVNEGGAGMAVYSRLRIMHEPGSKPVYHKLTDAEREEFRNITEGAFVPVAAYTFDNAGYITDVEDGHMLQLGKLPVMVDSETAQLIEGFTWAPKEPFDKIGFTRYLGVKKGPPTKEDNEAVERMTANSIWHEGEAATLN